jgi:hypothetical protein
MNKTFGTRSCNMVEGLSNEVLIKLLAYGYDYQWGLYCRELKLGVPIPSSSFHDQKLPFNINSIPLNFNITGLDLAIFIRDLF